MGGSAWIILSRRYRHATPSSGIPPDKNANKTSDTLLYAAIVGALLVVIVMPIVLVAL